jgi:hypothetical protein
MQEWLSHYFFLVFPLFFIGSWLFATYWVALTGGWRLLANRFRAQGPFTGRTWRMQSARMRWLCNYNNALTIGADETGLFMAPMIIFRAWHPPLFIPWTEIRVAGASQFFFFKFVDLRLGRSEDIPFKIRESLAANLQAAAGPGWPTETNIAMQTPPPPIA